MKKESLLFEKYDRAIPRYTSYPSVPYWQDDLSEERWIEALKRSVTKDKQISLYIHVPFCKSLCTYCGCHQFITKNIQRGKDYVDLVLKELALYQKKIPELKKCSVSELHLGGGTPTFLPEASLEKMISGVMQSFVVPKNTDSTNKISHGFHGSIEIDPRSTDSRQLQKVFDLGFRRVSLGVQDFNLKVQKLIHRIQPFEVVKEITDASRKIGFTSINFDLIYGLPQQKLEDINLTIDKTLELRPDRIALYSMALVPWMRPAQKLFDEKDLAQGAEKRALYEIARKRLMANGYCEVGMDHFSLPSDELYQASINDKLHRNFMGYTVAKTETLLGLGVSSISQTTECYHQNLKGIEEFRESLNTNKVATLKGHVLTEGDLLRSRQIREIMTELKTSLPNKEDIEQLKDVFYPLQNDGLIKIENKELLVLEKGRPFLRNIALLFDDRMESERQKGLMFSKL